MWDMFADLNSDNINSYNVQYGKGAAQTVFFDTYIKKLLKNLYSKQVQKGDLKYPMEIKIPPSPFEMAQGNFEPKAIIKIEKPLMFQDTPFWFNDGTKGINLRAGNIGGDSRLPSPYALDDKLVHGILTGKTGFGKSVTLNAIISSMAFEYAPWELELVLLDGKAGDIKRFGTTKLPHVTAVAATTDTDYIVSVLEAKYKEMLLMQAACDKMGVTKCADLRKVTGLCIPQVVIIIDEFQAIFKNAGKKLKEITELLGYVASLGRATNYHLFMASQGLGSDVPQHTLDQLTIRTSLGASEAVSNKILGNSGAAEILQKGKLLVNTNPEGKRKSENVLLRVPFQPGPEDGDLDQFTPQVNFLYSSGEHVGFVRPLSFYNETELMYESKFPAYLDRFNHFNDRIYLGEPGFVLNEEEQCVTMKFKGNDMENMLVFCVGQQDTLRYLRTIKYSLMRNKNIVQIGLIGDSEIEEGIGLKEAGVPCYNVSSSMDSSLAQVFDQVIIRNIMLQADEKVRESMQLSEAADNTMKEIFGEDTDLFTDLNRSRFLYIGSLMNTSFAKSLGISGYVDKEVVAQVQEKIFRGCFDRYRQMNCLEKLIRRDDFSMTFIWLLGLDKISGYGRDTMSSEDTKIKSILLLSTGVNVRFIMNIKNIDDFSAFVIGVRWVLLDQPSPNMARKVKAADFCPESCSKYLGILIDNVNKTASKFKKLCFDGEVIS